ncbi:hypothetical protein FGB62_99g020 [Gracilaria domingensis]|nr:hypothetical protein FGB62_99g020 [Gracilaria domingensis]
MFASGEGVEKDEQLSELILRRTIWCCGVSAQRFVAMLKNGCEEFEADEALAAEVERYVERIDTGVSGVENASALNEPPGRMLRECSMGVERHEEKVHGGKGERPRTADGRKTATSVVKR